MKEGYEDDSRRKIAFFVKKSLSRRSTRKTHATSCSLQMGAYQYIRYKLYFEQMIEELGWKDRVHFDGGRA